MNDALRFRVWDKVFNQYWTEEVIKENASQLLFPDNNNINDVKVEKYIGIKDRKLNHVYENDIVRLWFINRYILCTVKYCERTCGYYLYDKDGRKYTIEGDFEVVSNIHETPKHLKGK